MNQIAHNKQTFFQTLQAYPISAYLDEMKTFTVPWGQDLLEGRTFYLMIEDVRIGRLEKEVSSLDLSDEIATIIEPLNIPWKITKLPNHQYLTNCLKTIYSDHPWFLPPHQNPEN